MTQINDCFLKMKRHLSVAMLSFFSQQQAVFSEIELQTAVELYKVNSHELKYGMDWMYRAIEPTSQMQ